MTEALIAIVSLIIGTILNEFAATFRESRQTLNRNKSVRTIVAVEMMYNINSLKTITDTMAQIKRRLEVVAIERNMAEALLAYPPPPFRYIGLESQMSYLAEALNPEQITEVFSFYDEVRHLQSIRQELEELEKLEREFENVAKGFPDVNDRIMMKPLPSRPFYDKAPGLWLRYETISSRLVRREIPFEHKSIVTRRK